MGDETPTELGKTPKGMNFGLVTYLDLLGQRELFSAADSEALQDVLEFAGNYERSAGEAPGDSTASFPIPRSFVAFQDSLVRCTEIGWTDAPETLPAEKRAPLLARWILTVTDEIASIRDIQLNFLCKRGLLLRGAVALGVYGVTKGRVHGPAFINALQGEEKWAKYPRVLVDSKLMLSSTTNKFAHGWMEANTDRDPEDDNFFVDYLHGAACEVPWDASHYIEYALDHKHFIESKLRSKTMPADKLAWLHCYHNRSIRRTSTYIAQRSHMNVFDLLVNETAV
jgi:hypothetical protein